MWPFQCANILRSLPEMKLLQTRDRSHARRERPYVHCQLAVADDILMPFLHFLAVGSVPERVVRVYWLFSKQRVSGVSSLSFMALRLFPQAVAISRTIISFHGLVQGF